MKKLTLLFTVCTSCLMAQPASWTPHGLGGGGAQYSPSINPANSNEIYASSDMTELYHTVNGGNSWDVINFNYIMGGHSTMVQFTNNASIQYCMTTDPISGNYIPMVTNNAGATWDTLPTNPTSGNGAWYTIANPQNYNQIIVSDYNNLYLSNNGGTSFGSAFYTDNSGTGAYVAGTFFDGSNIYVCTDKGLLVSTNGGASWTGPTMPGIGAGEGIVSFTGAKSGLTTRFFCITITEADMYVGITGDNCYAYQNVYSLDYGSPNWTVKNTGIGSNDQPFYVGMCSTNINEAYLGGSNASTGYPIVFKTTNAGGNWNYVFNTTNNQNIQTGYCGWKGDFGWSWPQYIFGMNVSMSDSNTVVFTDMGFTTKTTDGGKTWQALYVPSSDLNPANASTPTRHYYHGNGMEVTSGWDLMWYDSKKMFAGVTDIHGIRTNDAGTTWGFDFSGLTNYNTTYKFEKNPSTGVIYAATSSIHDMYESTRLEDNPIDGGSGEVMFSTDTGSTFNTMHNFGKPVIWLALDPTSSTRMYASVINHSGAGSQGGIWICNDIQNGATSTWTHCTNPARTEGHPFNIRVLNDGTLIATYSGRRTPAGAFTDSSGVFVSTNQGSTWTDVSDPGMKYWTMDLVVDPWDTAQNTWYCCVFSGWGGPPNGLGGLYRTTNRGTSWTKINSLDRVYSITFDPVNKGQAYITTETQGLWYTSNINVSSPTFTQQLAYPFSHPNRLYFNPYNSSEIWANSFGNGLRVGSLVPTSVKELTDASSGVDVYPNPSNGVVSIVIRNKTVASKNIIEVYNVLGEKVFSTEVLANNLPISVNLGHQPAGLYFYKVSTIAGELVGDGKLEIK